MYLLKSWKRNNDEDNKLDGWPGMSLKSGWNNELAIEKGIREIVENFMGGLFAENYIDIFRESRSSRRTCFKVEELEQSVNEEVERNIEVKKELVEMKKDKALTVVCEGQLTHN